MARKKSYDIKAILGLLNEYKIENPGLKVTIPSFGSYIRNKGYDIKDHTLRRDDEFRQYLEEVNKGEENETLNDLVTYKTIDVDSFLEENNNKAKLKEAIINRDRYYANISLNAVKAIKEKKLLKNKNEKLEEKIKDLEGTIEKLKEEISNKKTLNEEIKEKNRTIIALKNVLEDYIYPDAANAILKKEGIIDTVNNIVADEVIEKQSIHADTNIDDFIIKSQGNSGKENRKSKFSSVDSILGDFDD